MLLDVCILNSKEVIYEGKAKSVILPGEQGVFEVLAFHKPILSRLLSGALFIDNQRIDVHRGIVEFHGNKLTAIIEEPRKD